MLRLYFTIRLGKLRLHFPMTIPPSSLRSPGVVTSISVRTYMLPTELTLTLGALRPKVNHATCAARHRRRKGHVGHIVWLSFMIVILPNHQAWQMRVRSGFPPHPSFDPHVSLAND
jgi:hypothetical protein